MEERRIRVYKSRRDEELPCIILQGKWLEEAGFHPGDYLSVSYENEVITISIKEKYIESIPVPARGKGKK